MIEQTASLLHQQAMAQFMKEGLWRSHIKKMRKTYKQKMSLFTRVITEVLGECVTIIGQHSGHYLLMKVHSKHTERWLIEQAYNEKGLRIVNQLLVEEVGHEGLYARFLGELKWENNERVIVKSKTSSWFRVIEII
ncbi:hypothetical protein [Priestia koreensis]|uniref:hypothetical protein n=1 Tax=Priestia koreensis TaxID=284581 RepID=UPI001F5AE44F|nr:hypothetical protein [Priestia koreensis]UNL86902.1 hypothetical protein IE339_10610 [Priestia koreensis]